MKKGLSASAKDEILSIRFESSCCERAFLSAIIHSAGSLLIASYGRLSVLIRQSTPNLRDKLNEILSQLYGVSPSLDGNSIVIESDYAVPILKDCAILSAAGPIEIVSGIDPKIIKAPCCKSAYAGGAFVGCGSISASKSGYHLEFKFEGRDLADDFSRLLQAQGIHAKYTERRNKHLIYLKDNESIGDCLALCGTGKMTLLISGMYVDRYVRKQSNRQLNCDLANLDRTISVGLRQAERFEKILDILDDERLLLTAKTRIDNPEISYEQLADMLNISKSGIKHRLKKLEEIAENSGF